MVLVKTAKELYDEETEAAKAEVAMVLNTDRDDRDNLSRHIWNFWEEASDAKEDIEDEMEAALNQRDGKYSDDKLSEISKMGGSAIFMTLTDEKCTAAKSWLVDILLPPDEKPWGVKSSPVADLPQDHIEIIRNKVQADMVRELEAAQQLGMALDEEDIASRMEELSLDIQNKVRERAKGFEDDVELAIADILAEGEWDEEFRLVIDDVVDLHAGILKGPIVEIEKRLAWSQGVEGWVAETVDTMIPKFKRVSPFDIYPAASATGFDDGDLIEVHRLTYEDLSALKGQPGYNDKEIEKVLDTYNYGGLGDWLDINDTTGAILTAEQEESDQLNFTVSEQNNKIQAIQYWGCVRGDMLYEWGFKDVENDSTPYQIEAWMIGNHVIKAILNGNPLGIKPYFKASFRNRNGRFWGDGLPMVIKDIQDMCNAAARNLVNNMAIASGPQVGIDVGRLAEGESITSMFPWKMWQFDESLNVTSGGRPPIWFFQPESNAGALMQVYQFFSTEADNKSGIPKYSYGSGGSAGALGTATGMSMMMSNASKAIKQVVYNIDAGVIKPSVQHTHTYLMLTSKDESIKGDINILARGSSALLAKEQQQVRRNEALQLILQPPISELLGRKGLAAAVREVFRGLDFPVDDIVPSKAEMDQMEKAMGMTPQATGTPATAPTQTDQAGNVAGGGDVNAFQQGRI